MSIEPLRVGERRIGSGEPVFVIAEAGINHNGSLDRAFELIDEAKAAGVDAVKFQKRDLAEVYQRKILANPNIAEQKYQDLIPLLKEFELPAYDAEVLTASKNLAGFFEETVALHANAKAVSNFVMGEVNRYLSENKKGIEKTALTPKKLAQLLDLIESGAINLKTAKLIFPDIVRSDRSPEKIVKQRGLAQVSDESELRQIVQEVVRNNPNETAKYLAGKIKVMGFLVGRVMRATRGKGNPKMVNQLLLEELNKRKHD